MVGRTAYTDGACRVSNPGLCSAAWAIYEDGVLKKTLSWVLGGLNTNNQAEYHALVALLDHLDRNQVKNVTIHSDSLLVVKQVNGEWRVKGAQLGPLCLACVHTMRSGEHSLVHVSGHAGNEGNELCDKLCNEVLDEIQAKEKQ